MNDKNIIVYDIQEEYVTIYNPKGEEIVTTNNPLVFDDIRLQIAEKQLEGYYFIHRNNKYPIESDGDIIWSDGLFDKQFILKAKLLNHKFKWKI